MGKRRGSKGSGSGSGSSLKSEIIEAIFLDRWDAGSHRLRKPIVTLKDISSKIAQLRSSLSTGNPANFFKDFVRNKDSANNNWPRAVLSKGYTAVQETGQGNCFRFVPLAIGQTIPFPKLAYPRNAKKAFQYDIQSASLSPFARLLGRTDETWLIQVIVRLRVVETHFALFSKTGLIHVDHLQTGIKGTITEIDAVFLGETGVVPPNQGVGQKRALITLEAKGARDDILEDQILRQVKAALSMQALKGKIDFVVPMAAKSIGASEIYVAEYKPVKADGAQPSGLSMAVEAVYKIKPPVPGIG